MFGFGASAQDFMVQQRIAGASMQVEVTMPAGGMAAVQGDSIGGQGLYDIPVHSANALETIGTADPSNPRVDQVILEVQDNVLDASGGNLARTRVLTGTPTGGANLTNRTGAAVLPGSALLLADVLVGAAAGSITNTVIRDRRKWARGAYIRIARTAGNIGPVGNTTYVLADSALVNPRIECSGVPLKARLAVVITSAAALQTSAELFMDSATFGTGQERAMAFTGAYNTPQDYEWEVVPGAGSHVFGPAVKVNTSNITLNSSGALPLVWVLEEIVRPSAANNTVTSG